MIKYTIKTDKGYICESNAKGCYPKASNEFYRVETGKFFSTITSDSSDVDCLGFTSQKEDATRYSGNIGNRVQEIADRIKFGYEDIKTIIVEVQND